MTKIAFWKLSGAGNDFVLLEEPRAGAAALARKLCCRRTGIGADGLLLVDARARVPRVDYLNNDGSIAFCGNGTRCAAWWLRATGRSCGDAFQLKTSRGVLDAVITGREKARVRMPDVTRIRLGDKLRVDGGTVIVHRLDSGVPHAVLEFEDLERVPVESLGRELRRHRAFGKAGANVDFLAKKGGQWILRTYERGVEAETLACGTGVTAAAVAAHLVRGAKPPVRVRVRSGDVMTVSFAPASRGAGELSDVWLEGPARIVFQGEVRI